MKELRANRADFYTYRGDGGFLTVWVSQPVASSLCPRLTAWSPSSVTLLGLSEGIATTVAASRVPVGWAAALVALIGWNAAYVLDCADGQLARALGRATTAGARLDLLADLAQHVAIGVAVAFAGLLHGVHPWLLLIFAATRPLGTAVARGAPASASGSRKRRGLRRHLFDFPSQSILLAGAFATPGLAWLAVSLLATASVLQLVAAITSAFRSSLQEMSREG